MSATGLPSAGFQVAGGFSPPHLGRAGEFGAVALAPPLREDGVPAGRPLSGVGTWASAADDADHLAAARHVDDVEVSTGFADWAAGVLPVRGAPVGPAKGGLRLFHAELRDFPRACHLLAQGTEAARDAGADLEI
ncbi:hypothetical protein OHA77_39350 [Streptosporangium sp. NBC_01639]|uniref:hypothetical protein n=1 Tax=Streptosporangium sp. NBC_01639 TaxID=2975948 RepID=UPI003867C084|nr:hypothetical protein OHA77_39350 [Streptosporangium sp. NBC_01639]